MHAQNAAASPQINSTFKLLTQSRESPAYPGGLHINLRNRGLDTSSFNVAMNLLLKFAAKIASLDLSLNPAVGDVLSSRLSEIVPRTSRLAYLSLEGAKISAGSATSILKILSDADAIESLNMAEIRLGPTFFAALGGLLISRRLQTLRILNIANTGTADGDVARFFGPLVASSGVQRLDMSANRLTDEGAAHVLGLIIACKETALVRVDLSNNSRISGGLIEAIGAAVSQKCCATKGSSAGKESVGISPQTILRPRKDPQATFVSFRSCSAQGHRPSAAEPKPESKPRKEHAMQLEGRSRNSPTQSSFEWTEKRIRNCGVDPRSHPFYSTISRSGSKRETSSLGRTSHLSAYSTAGHIRDSSSFSISNIEPTLTNIKRYSLVVVIYPGVAKANCDTLPLIQGHPPPHPRSTFSAANREAEIVVHRRLLRWHTSAGTEHEDSARGRRRPGRTHKSLTIDAALPRSFPADSLPRLGSETTTIDCCANLIFLYLSPSRYYYICGFR